MKTFPQLFLRTPRLPRSNNLETKNNENSIMKSDKNKMILKFWPQWPRKQYLNLSSLRGCQVDFILDYIFKISGFHWSKWAIDCLNWKPNLIHHFNFSLPNGPQWTSNIWYEACWTFHKCFDTPSTGAQFELEILYSPKTFSICFIHGYSHSIRVPARYS